MTADCTGCHAAAIRKWTNPTGPCCVVTDARDVTHMPTRFCRVCGLLVPAENTLPYCTPACFELDRPRVLSVHDHLLVGSNVRGR